jgi:hypothetical protein
MQPIDLDIMKAKSGRQPKSSRLRPSVQNPLTGGYLGKGQSRYVDPGANVEELFNPDQLDFQKGTDADLTQQRLTGPHEWTENTQINREKLRMPGLHFL